MVRPCLAHFYYFYPSRLLFATSSLIFYYFRPFHVLKSNCSAVEDKMNEHVDLIAWVPRIPFFLNWIVFILENVKFMHIIYQLSRRLLKLELLNVVLRLFNASFTCVSCILTICFVAVSRARGFICALWDKRQQMQVRGNAFTCLRAETITLVALTCSKVYQGCWC